ncbi:MAG: MFS transporter, partial [Acidobacteria bacterium]|nr:MFS transporter [Acidobacteriota bacterium]
LPTWITATHGATPSQIASVFFVGGVASALTGPIAGRLSDRIGRKQLILTSCLGLAAIMLSVTLVVREFWVTYPVFFLAMVLVAARMSPFQALLSALVKGERRGTLMSFTVAIGQIGFAFGGAVAGLAYARFGYWSNAVAGAASVLLMGLLVWRYLPEPARHETISLPSRAPLSEAAAEAESVS